MYFEAAGRRRNERVIQGDEKKKKAVNVHVKYFSVCSCMTFSWGLKDVQVRFVILYVIFIYLFFSTLTWRYNDSAKLIFLTVSSITR